VVLELLFFRAFVIKVFKSGEQRKKRNQKTKERRGKKKLSGRKKIFLKNKRLAPDGPTIIKKKLSAIEICMRAYEKEETRVYDQTGSVAQLAIVLHNRRVQQAFQSLYAAFELLVFSSKLCDQNFI
jgi:hypothetical protein